jgi:hypothetical protein
MSGESHPDRQVEVAFLIGQSMEVALLRTNLNTTASQLCGCAAIKNIILGEKSTCLSKYSFYAPIS